MKVLIARICLGHTERCEVGTWGMRCFQDAYRGKSKLDIDLNSCVIDKAGTHCARNYAVKKAREAGVDILFMVDADNGPHKDFFLFACQFLREHPAAVLASPYCGNRPMDPSQPDRRVNVTIKDANSTHGKRYITRDEAVDLVGVQPAYGVPTGAIAIGMRVFDALPPPWFDYRYTDEFMTESGTEDFYFSEKVVDEGGEVFVSWDHWADHLKIERIGKPEREEVVAVTAAVTAAATTATTITIARSWPGETFEHDADWVTRDMDAVRVAVQAREPYGWKMNGSPKDEVLDGKPAYLVFYVRSRNPRAANHNPLPAPEG
jgi:glycosyltransferase involved in cell wall biosynthesis